MRRRSSRGRGRPRKKLIEIERELPRCPHCGSVDTFVSRSLLFEKDSIQHERTCRLCLGEFLCKWVVEKNF